MENWQGYLNQPEELVLSSRIRIARNLKGTPFPHMLSDENGRSLVKKIEESFYNSVYTKNYYKTHYLWQNDEKTNWKFFEEHLVSPALLKNKDKAAFLLKEDETVSIMLNEEDHIRLQCIGGGFDIRDCYDNASKLDDLLDEVLDYAFHERLGYITACPTNIGTGLRASVMIHLPAVTMNNEVEKILKALTQIGMTIRGLYGEGSKAKGNIYQISNQITLGISEEDIITNLEAVVRQIVNQENNTREVLMEKYKYEMEDKIFRSIGILKTAVMLNLDEFMELLSNVRMGIELGLIKDVDKTALNQILTEGQPASLQKKFNAEFSEKEVDINRARLVKEILK